MSDHEHTAENGPLAAALRLAANELERAVRAGAEVDVPWWWMRDQADRLDAEASRGGCAACWGDGYIDHDLGREPCPRCHIPPAKGEGVNS